MRPLPCRIGMGNHGARLAQPKAPLPEEALTLPHPQADLEALLDPGTQRFSIPQRAAQAEVARSLPQRLVHFLQLRPAQPSGPPTASPFLHPPHTPFLQTSDPHLPPTTR